MLLAAALLEGRRPSSDVSALRELRASGQAELSLALLSALGQSPLGGRSPGRLSPASLCPRSVHRLREAALSRSMELYRNAPPTAIGVPAKLLPREPGASAAGAYPYCAAARELGLLVLESCPQKKLECIGEGAAVWEDGGRTGGMRSLPRG